MNTNECLTCQTNRKERNGETLTEQELRMRSLWGCTCDPETEREALDFMQRVTQ